MKLYWDELSNNVIFKMNSNSMKLKTTLLILDLQHLNLLSI